MKLGIKRNTVTQCFNLFLQAPFLILKVPLYLKNSASTAATLWVAAWSIVCGWTLQHQTSFWPQPTLFEHSLYSFRLAS